jgi:tetratricopeptide (TPR) repeat protein
VREVIARHFLVGDVERDRYSFRHELVREAVYADLVLAERVQLHSALAEAIAGDPGLVGGRRATAAAAVAHHWHAAGDLRRAVGASVQAGQEATRILAFAEAHRQFGRALELWNEAPITHTELDRSQLLEQAAEAAHWAGEADQAIALLRQALAEVDPVREPVRAGVLQERLGGSLWRWGDSNASLAAYVEANRLLAGSGASPERARALASEGAALMAGGWHSESRARSEQAIAMARAIGARQEEGYALNTLGVSLTMLGDPEAGVDALERSKRIAEAIGNVEDLQRAYNNLAFALENAGRFEARVKVALKGLELARRAGLELTMGAVVLANTAEALLQVGRWQEAEELISEAPKLESGARFGPYLRLCRAQIDLALGRFDSAAARLEAAREASARLDEPYFLGPFHGCLAELAIWHGDRRRAAAAVQQGLRLVERGDDHRMALWLCALGIRAEADEADRERGLADGPRVEASIVAGAVLVARARAELSEKLVLPEGHCSARLCEAEHARLQGRPDPDLWDAAATSWERLCQPYRTTYVRWRHAEALLLSGASEEGAAVLRQAHEAARAVRADPVRHQLELVASRNGIELPKPVTIA